MGCSELMASTCILEWNNMRERTAMIDQSFWPFDLIRWCKDGIIKERGETMPYLSLARPTPVL